MTALLTSNGRWDTPPPSALRRSAPWIAVVVILAMIGGGAYLLFRPAPPAPPAPPRAATGIELAGIAAATTAAATNPLMIHGKITGPSGIPVEVSVSYGAGHTSGFGTVTVAGRNGDALMVDSKQYLRGSSAFWSALGVSTAYAGWVKLDPTFLKGQAFPDLSVLFKPVTTVGATVSTDGSRVEKDGTWVRVNAGAVTDAHSAKMGTEVSVQSSDTEVGSAVAAQITAAGDIGNPATMTSVGDSVFNITPPAPPAPAPPPRRP